jgi:hypothetical protein
MTTTTENESALIERFVASFVKLDELSADQQLDPIAWHLAIGDPNQYGLKRWRPKKTITQPDTLKAIYAKLPGRFPPVYERLILSYRWAEIDLESYRLLANPAGPDLNGLLEQISKDPAIFVSLSRAGHLQFGMGPDTDYDPVCFDLNSRGQNGDCCVVKIDHEEILCSNRAKVIGELAPSFEQLVLGTISRANQVLNL